MIARTSATRRAAVASVYIVAVLSLLVLAVPATVAEEFEGSASQTGLYDEADVLSDEEVQEIESRIAEVEAAGAPTVVYLRLLASEEGRAVDDARHLMEEWDVQSREGARDGFVILLNLNPEDPDRGELGIVAGQAHFDGGALPQSELDRIRDEMIERLADDRMAEGIIRGLELTAEQLRAGPPEPGAFESFARQVASGPVSPLNIVSLTLAGLLGIAGLRIWSDRPRSPQLQYQSTTELPGDEHPAIAGALEAGRVRHPQIEATMIMLGRRGALQFEPDPEEDEKVQVRLLDRSLAGNAFEQKLLDVLSEHAEGGVLTQQQLAGSQSDWDDIQHAIRRNLVERGWFDPDAGSRRRPLIIYGIASVLLGAIALPSLPFVGAPWPLIGAGLLFVVGIVLFSLVSAYPSTTFEGEQAAAPWRAYRNGMREASGNEATDLDLDTTFPYIVALGLSGDFHDQLERASENGYIPAWFQFTGEQSYTTNTWFIYWVAFHYSMTPQSGGAGAGGGAATGSGGSGGSF